MPNHIQNQLTITGEDSEEIFTFLAGGDNIIDFNKIVPMPDALDITPHGGIENAVKNSLHMGFNKNRHIALLEESNRAKTKSPLEFSDKDFETYISCICNVRKHRYMYWYPWAIEKWGTKWNAYSQEREGSILRFETAWGGVPDLIQRLSKMFAGIVFDYLWADEDTGHNVGHITYRGGTEIFSKLPENGSIDAYELRFELCPDDRQYYRLERGNYVFIEEIESA